MRWAIRSLVSVPLAIPDNYVTAWTGTRANTRAHIMCSNRVVNNTDPLPDVGELQVYDRGDMIGFAGMEIISTGLGYATVTSVMTYLGARSMTWYTRGCKIGLYYTSYNIGLPRGWPNSSGTVRRL